MGAFLLSAPRMAGKPALHCRKVTFARRGRDGAGRLPAAALRTVLFSGAVRSLYAYFAQNIPARACGLAGSMVN